MNGEWRFRSGHELPVVDWCMETGGDHLVPLGDEQINRLKVGSLLSTNASQSLLAKVVKEGAVRVFGPRTCSGVDQVDP